MSLKQTLKDENDESSFNNMKFDDAAFEIFFKKYFKSLCAYCQYKFGFDLDVAKEVVHTGFIKLWETRQNRSPDLSIKAYLYKIITNNSLDILKHQKVKQKYEKYFLQNNSETDTGNDFGSTDFKKLSADIDKAIEELPEQMRKIFILSRYKGLKYSAIAQQLDISVKTVETQMSRALVKLRQKLADYLVMLVFIIVAIGLKNN